MALPLPVHGARGTLLVCTEQRVYPLAVPPGEWVLGRSGADLVVDEAGVAARHLRLHFEGAGLEVECLEGTSARLNDVQLTGASKVRPGDELRLGDTQLVFQLEPVPVAQPPRVEPWSDFEARLAERLEAARRLRERCSVLLWQFPGASVRWAVEQLAAHAAQSNVVARFGGFGPWVAVLLPEVGREALEPLRSAWTAEFGASGRRFRLGHASFPEDGLHAQALLAKALDRWRGPGGGLEAEAPLFVEPVMLRVAAAVERLAALDFPVRFSGAPGSGKEQLARWLHQQGPGRDGPFERFVCAQPGPPDAVEAALFGAVGAPPGAFERVGAGCLLLVHPEELPEPVQAKLAQVLQTRRYAPLGGTARAFEGRAVAATAEQAALAKPLADCFAHAWVAVPSLGSRPAEVLPLAEHVLQRVRRASSRTRLTLSAGARRRLAEHPWPGGVRELRLCVELAAFAARGDELLASDLPLPQSPGRGPAERLGMRTLLQETERETLLAALGATGWNVTQAAQQLGLPRRTLVYRMGRLGLRRPARG